MRDDTERGTRERQEATESIEPSGAAPEDAGIGAERDAGPGGEPEHAIEDRPREQARDEPEDEGFSAGLA